MGAGIFPPFLKPSLILVPAWKDSTSDWRLIRGFRFLPTWGKEFKRVSSMRIYRNLSPNYPVYQNIYDVVRQIPKGKVATYGQIAKIIGRCTARMVGYAMAALPWGVDVPWQRVINYRGEISPRAHGDGSIRQRKLLVGEGIRFDSQGQVDFKKVRWSGPKERLKQQRSRNEERQ